jgi:glycosyltransferase involved in cell wall biosynthesis
MNPPLVSICVPTYMGEKFIAETIRSILDQTHNHLEVIIVDDCSTDGTLKVVEKFDDSRIRYYRNELNLGPEGNWNRCLDFVKGKYYKLLPHDDLLLPHCIEDQVAVLEGDENKDIALVFGAKRIINSAGKKVLERYPLGKENLTIDGHSLIKRCIRSGSNMIGEPGSGLIRSELLSSVGGYDVSNPYVIDLDYWFRVLSHGDGFYLGKVSSCFRISNEAWTAKIGKLQHSDYIHLVEKYYLDDDYQVSRYDKINAYVRSYIITIARRTIYVSARFLGL